MVISGRSYACVRLYMLACCLRKVPGFVLWMSGPVLGRLDLFVGVSGLVFLVPWLCICIYLYIYIWLYLYLYIYVCIILCVSTLVYICVGVSTYACTRHPSPIAPQPLWLEHVRRSLGGARSGCTRAPSELNSARCAGYFFPPFFSQKTEGVYQCPQTEGAAPVF